MRNKFIGYIASFAVLATAVLLLLPLRGFVNTATIGLAFVIVVLLIATTYGSIPAIAVSILTMLSFNYFFIPPYHTFRVDDPQNWVALSAFLLTSLIAGGLSAREKKRAMEAQILYRRLQDAFEKASQAEALKQSEQLKSALLDAVTHDLRTPLTSMKAAVTTMLSGTQEADSGLDEEGRRELLEVVDAEIDRMNRLVEEMIQMAKIEAGAMQPERKWSSVEEIFTNALHRSSGIANEHKILLNMEPALPMVRVDEITIAEVLYILIENATKFSPPKSEIVVSASKDSAGIKISVEDRGAGIPVELRKKVFDKFFRVSGMPAKSRDVRPPGLGMGLAIARAIVEAHGGRIWVDDQVGKPGTRMSFVIPFQQEGEN